jgi:hypothetical protein
MTLAFAPGLRAVREYNSTTNVGFDPGMFASSVQAHLTAYTPRYPWLAFYSGASTTPDFTTRAGLDLTNLLNAAEDAGKFVNLIVVPGFYAPEWVKTAVASTSKEWFKDVSVAGDPCTILPVPMGSSTTTYRSKWHTFLNQLSSAYAQHRALRFIAVGGPTAESVEIRLPDATNSTCANLNGAGSSEIDRWRNNLGYTLDAYTQAWTVDLQHTATVFPNQYLSLALHRTLPLGNGSPADRAASYGVTGRQAIIDIFKANYPTRFSIQNSGLDGTGVAADGYDIVTYEGGFHRVHQGYQCQTSWQNNSTAMGNSTDGVHAGYLTIQKAVEGQAEFLEVYQPDWLTSTWIGTTPPVVGMTSLQMLGTYKNLFRTR